MKQSEKNKRIIVGLFIIAVIICVMIVVYCVTHADFVIDTTDAQAKQLATSSTVSEKTYQEIQKYLSKFSNDRKTLVEEGCFVIGFHQIIGGSDLWKSFYESYQGGEAAEIVLAQFTDEGDAILDYLYYDGNKVYHVSDASRDGFLGNGEKYYEETFSYLKVYENTADNGDRTSTLVLTDNDALTYEEWQDLLYDDTDQEGAPVEYRYLTQIILGNGYAELPENTGEGAWHDVAYTYDMSQILIPREEIATVRIVNGSTGEAKRFAVTDGSNAYNEIMDLYEGLSVSLDEDMVFRSGYAYFMEILDANGNILQRVTPYRDAVTIDGEMYDGSANGTSMELLLKLDELDWNK